MLELQDLPMVPNTIDDPVDPKIVSLVETTQFSLICFTIPFYSLILLFVIIAQFQRVDELCTPFFKLCITTAIIDLITLLTNYFGAMFPKWGWFVKMYLFLGNYWSTTYFFLAWFSGVAQAMSVSIMATNRLSAIIYPNRHYIIWSSGRLNIAYILQFLPGCLVGMITFVNSTQLYKNNNNGIVPKFVNENITYYLFLVCGAFLLIVCTYLIIAYCYLFYILRKSSAAMQFTNASFNKMRTRIRKREAKLFFMSTITVTIQITALCFLIIYNFSLVQISLEEFYLFYNAFSDIYSGINPYLLWIFSDVLRKYILQEIGIGEKRKPSKQVSMFVGGGNSAVTVL